MNELQRLSEIKLGFSIEATDFETAEIDFFLNNGQRDTESDTPEDDGFELAETAVTQLGDILCLGDHRLICGDRLQGETDKSPTEDETARMVFTDPRHRKFAMA